MRLLRYGPPGEERPGLLDDQGHPRDLSEYVSDITPEVLAPERLARLATIDPRALPEVPGHPRIGAPVTGIGKILAIGLNYAAHAAEAGVSVPAEPVVFSKATSAVTGPYDPIVIPRGGSATDWEVELGVVIGRKAQYVPDADALSHVAGYLVINDISERDFQLTHGGQWVKGKSADTFAPLGPWLVTADEVPDPQNLRLWLEVDGRRRQDASTASMIFGVAYLIGYLSRFMTLMPGDVIATGTPVGTALGQTPPDYLRPGQILRFAVEGLGEQRHEVVAHSG